MFENVHHILGLTVSPILLSPVFVTHNPPIRVLFRIHPAQHSSFYIFNTAPKKSWGFYEDDVDMPVLQRSGKVYGLEKVPRLFV